MIRNNKFMNCVIVVLMLLVSSVVTQVYAATNITISTAATSGVTYSSGTYTPVAGAATAVINLTELQNYLAGTNVNITTASTGTSAGTITVSSALSWGSAYSLTLTAQSSLTVNAAITNSGSGGIILMAAQGADALLTVNTGYGLTTNGGPVSLTAGTATIKGSLIIAGSITSNNGDITIANTSAGGNTLQEQGMIIRTGTLSSGTGNISLVGYGRVSGTACEGVLMDTYGTIQSTTGSVSINGTGGVGSNRGEGVLLNNYTVNTASGPINISGTGGSSGGRSEGVHFWYGSTEKIYSTSGDINLTATGQGPNGHGFIADYTEATSGNSTVYIGYDGTTTGTTGNITLKADAKNAGLQALWRSGGIFKVKGQGNLSFVSNSSIGSSGTTTFSGVIQGSAWKKITIGDVYMGPIVLSDNLTNITAGDDISVVSKGSITINNPVTNNTTGKAITILAAQGATGTGTLTTIAAGTLTTDNGAIVLRSGVSADNATVSTAGGAMSISGPVSMGATGAQAIDWRAAGNMLLYTDLSTYNTANTSITLYGNQGVQGRSDFTKSMTTNGGAISIYAGTDAAVKGSIYLNQGATNSLTSNGGAITLQNSTQGGYWNNGTDNLGIGLAPAYINAGAGNVTINSTASASANTSEGLLLAYGDIQTTTGDINITAKGAPGTNYYSCGIIANTDGEQKIHTTSGKINITATGAASGTRAEGIMFYGNGNTSRIYSASGDINIVANSNRTDDGHGIISNYYYNGGWAWNWNTVYIGSYDNTTAATTGNISITGDTKCTAAHMILHNNAGIFSIRGQKDLTLGSATSVGNGGVIIKSGMISGGNWRNVTIGDKYMGGTVGITINDNVTTNASSTSGVSVTSAGSLTVNNPVNTALASAMPISLLATQNTGTGVTSGTLTTATAGTLTTNGGAILVRSGVDASGTITNNTYGTVVVNGPVSMGATVALPIDWRASSSLALNTALNTSFTAGKPITLLAAQGLAGYLDINGSLTTDGGEVKGYGGVTASGTLTSFLSTVSMQTGKAITTNGGNITLQNGKTGGYTGWYNGRGLLLLGTPSINAGGGNIVLKGHGTNNDYVEGVYLNGTVTTTTGTIDIYGKGALGSQRSMGIYIGEGGNTSIYTTSGDITMTGENTTGGSWGQAIKFQANTTKIYSTSGNLTFLGSCSTGGHNVFYNVATTYIGYDNASTITSGKIKFIGDESDALLLYNTGTFKVQGSDLLVMKSRTPIGNAGFTLSGVVQGTAWKGIQLGDVYTGAITVSDNLTTSASATDGISVISKAGITVNNPLNTSAKADLPITLLAAQGAAGTGTLTTATAGTLTTDNGAIVLRSGVSADNATVSTAGGAMSISGPVSMGATGAQAIDWRAAGNMLLYTDLSTSATANTAITLYGNQGVQGRSDFTKSMTTNGGAISIYAGTDAAVKGSIYLTQGATNSLTSNGGAITLQNSALGGYWNNGTDNIGMSLNPAYINAGAGNVTINSTASASGNNSYGLQLGAGDIQTATGDINITSKGAPGTNWWSCGILANTDGEQKIHTTSGKINITATGAASGSRAEGIVFYGNGNTSRIYSASGDINMVVNSNRIDDGHGIITNYYYNGSAWAWNWNTVYIGSYDNTTAGTTGNISITGDTKYNQCQLILHNNAGTFSIRGQKDLTLGSATSVGNGGVIIKNGMISGGNWRNITIGDKYMGGTQGITLNDNVTTNASSTSGVSVTSAGSLTVNNPVNTASASAMPISLLATQNTGTGVTSGTLTTATAGTLTTNGGAILVRSGVDASGTITNNTYGDVVVNGPVSMGATVALPIDWRASGTLTLYTALNTSPTAGKPITLLASQGKAGYLFISGNLTTNGGEVKGYGGVTASGTPTSFVSTVGLETGKAITTNGGNITLQNGTTGGYTGWCNGRGLLLLGTPSINAGGGNIVLKGYATNNDYVEGVYLNGTVTTTTGTIDIYGKGATGSQRSMGIFIGEGGNTSIYTTSGDITMTGENTTGGSWAQAIKFHANTTKIYSSSGNLTFYGTTPGGQWDFYNAATTYIGWDNGSTITSGKIKFFGDDATAGLLYNGGTFKVQGSDLLVMKSRTPIGNAGFTLSGVVQGTAWKGIQLGDVYTGAITVSDNLTTSASATDGISVISKAGITVNNPLNTSAKADLPITLLAAQGAAGTGTLTTAAAATLSTANGPILLRSGVNADGSVVSTAAGHIVANGAVNMVSVGVKPIDWRASGDLTLSNSINTSLTSATPITLLAAQGVDGLLTFSSGYALTTAGGAVNLTSGTATKKGSLTIAGSIASNNGNISIANTSTGASSTDYGVQLSAGAISTGTGNLVVNAYGKTSGGNFSEGLYLTNSGSINSTSGTITLNGVGGAGAYRGAGIFTYNNYTINSASGPINLKGQGNGANRSDGIHFYGSGATTKIYSASGDINLTGMGGGTDGYGFITDFQDRGVTSPAVNGNVYIGYDGTNGGTTGNITMKADAVSSGYVALWRNTGVFKIKGQGDLSFISNSSVGSSGNTFSGVIQGAAWKKITIGDVYMGPIVVSDNLTNTSSGDDISVTSKGSITLNNPVTNNTTGKAITVLAAQGAAGTGTLTTVTAATLTTDNGSIVLRSGVNADGSVVSTAAGHIAASGAVSMGSTGAQPIDWRASGNLTLSTALNTSATSATPISLLAAQGINGLLGVKGNLTTNNGLISLYAAKDASGTDLATPLGHVDIYNNVTINAGTADVIISNTGKGSYSTGAWYSQNGIMTNANGSGIVSVVTGVPTIIGKNISLTGTGYCGGATEATGLDLAGLNITASGNIAMTGTAGTLANNAASAGIRFVCGGGTLNSSIYTTGATSAITITGTGKASAGAGIGLWMGGTAQNVKIYNTGGTGAITLNAVNATNAAFTDTHSGSTNYLYLGSDNGSNVTAGDVAINMAGGSPAFTKTYIKSNGGNVTIGDNGSTLGAITLPSGSVVASTNGYKSFTIGGTKTASVAVNTPLTASTDGIQLTAIGDISGTGALSAVKDVVTVNTSAGTGAAVYSGTLAGDTWLTKTGAGVFKMTAPVQTFTGNTTITGGELRLNPSATTATWTSPVVLNGGTLGTTGITANTVWTSSNTLTVNDNSTIALASGTVHSLKFAASPASSWADGKRLTVTGWTGTTDASGTGGKVFVGTDITGLGSSGYFYKSIYFATQKNYAKQLPTGEVVPTLIPEVAYTTPNEFPKGTAITPLTPTLVSGAAVTNGYFISPSLPAGLAFSTLTGVISGTPTTMTAKATYVVTVSNQYGYSASNVEIAITDVLPVISYPVATQVYTKGSAITSLTPTSTGGAVVSYSVSPALPAGLAINSTTGVISGTPTEVVAQATYRVTATNITGQTGTFDEVITVNDIAPVISYTTPNVYPKESVVPALTPVSTGGTVVSYSVSPALPAGLSIDPATGVISGTPSAITAGATYRVTATNSGGSATADVVITVTDALKQLSLKVYLQGLWSGSGMNQCYDENGSPVFTNAVDVVDVELHDKSSYATIVYKASGLYLDVDGTVHSNGKSDITIPATFGDSYYITVRTRNHLETTTSNVVSFAGSTIGYDFTTAAGQAYGDNQADLGGGVYGLYVGDVPDESAIQDGYIDISDAGLVDVQITAYTMGYVKEDINGDGYVDISDAGIVDNNVSQYISSNVDVPHIKSSQYISSASHVRGVDNTTTVRKGISKKVPN